MESCVEGTSEVFLSLTASTLTTVAVFLPLGLTGGMAGMLFKDFCLTIAFLILASLVIAVTLVPLLCYFLLDENRVRRQALKQARKKDRPTLGSKLMNGYIRVLDFFVHQLGLGMLASLALVVVFTVTCLSTNMVLMPAMDQGMVAISVSTPIGTEMEQTTAIADRIVAVSQENVPELETLYYTAQPESASVSLSLVDKSQRDRSNE